MLNRPFAGVCNVAQTNTEIGHDKWNNKRVGFRAEISSAANEEDCKSISSYAQYWKKPAKKPIPSIHLF